MKIITWNVNGYRAITGQNASKRFDKISKENKLFGFIEEEKPDILCLQEIKAEPSQILEELRTPEGYFSYYNYSKGKRGYSGVAVFSKIEPKIVNDSLGQERFDMEGRVLECTYDGFTLFNIYFPKGYTENERLSYKMDFYDNLFDYIKNNFPKEHKLIICGDYNTAHEEIDLARPKDNINTSGFLLEEREKLDEMLQLGFVDAFRQINSLPNHYTWWSQRSGARAKNIGWRIDYHFVSDSLITKLANCTQRPEIMGSDHCPVILEIDL
jgi:exodeoxyribonuclease III